MAMWECMNDGGMGGLYCNACADQYRKDNDIDPEQTAEDQWQNGAYAAQIWVWDYDRDNTNCDDCGVECDIDQHDAPDYNGEDDVAAVAAARHNDPDNNYGRDEEYWA